MFITIELSEQFRQLLPVIFGAFLSVTFGMGLGWPCIAYPYLLNDDVTPIPITLDDTALIAGFLMEGNTIGSLFSTSKLLPAKLAVSLCCFLQISGWVLMFYSRNIFWFLGSRASVGFANGYGMGQLKRYIKDTCDPDLADTINNYLPVGINVGVLITFTYGAFVDFRSLALYAVIVPSIGFLGFTLIPKLERKTDSSQRVRNALESTMEKDEMSMAKNITPPPVSETAEGEPESNTVGKPFTVFEVLRDRDSRNGLFLMFLIVFVQQYSGGPANLVYSQIIFTSTANPYPKLCSIIYGITALINIILALTFAKNIRRKTNLLVGTLACIFCYVLVALYFFLRNELYQINELFTWAPLFLLMLWNVFHTFSFGVLSLLQLKESLPKRSLNVLSKFWTIHFSMSAVISTKIFQVIFGMFGMGMGYTFFIFVLVGNFLIAIFIKDYTPKGKLEVNGGVESATVQRF